tara:strand:- start:5914 stop:6756 length:843 start_codon:yes stop_codon:yes gene_type:complete
MFKLTDAQLKSIEDQCFVDTNNEEKYPPLALSFGKNIIKTKTGKVELPVPIGTYGNFSFVQAPPKTLKTYFISLLASVYLSGKNKYGGDIRGYRDKKCLIHFDTEQGKFHAHRTFRRVIDMNNGNDIDCYHTFGLRTISYKHRIEFIEHYLKNKIPKNKVGLVIIDGIADLCNDVNNIEQSNDVVQKIMEWSQLFNCHIITIIHTNHGNSEKPTGHLGSFLEKKTETQIQLSKNTTHKGWISVTCKRSRGYSFEQFSFKIDDFGLPVVITDLYNPLKDFE